MFLSGVKYKIYMQKSLIGYINTSIKVFMFRDQSIYAMNIYAY